MKKLLLFIVGFIILGVQPVHADIATGYDWAINSFDAAITIQPSGKVQVVEEIAVDYGTVQKHGIYRDLPIAYKNTDGSDHFVSYKVTAIKRDGNDESYVATYNGDLFDLKIGDANQTVQGKHTYQVSYLATGVLQKFNGYDELNWNVTGNNWPVGIQSVLAEVHTPESGITQVSCYVGVLGSTTHCTQEFTGQVAQFSQSQPLQVGEGMTVAVGYTSGMVPILTVSQRPSSLTDFEQNVSLPTLFGSFILVLMVGVGLIFRTWWKKGRDADGRKINRTIAPVYESPNGLRPGEIGLLIDEHADTLDVTATIVDLAVRGFLTITELPKKWVLASADYTLTRTNKSDTKLLGYEQSLLEALFTTGSEVTISTLKNTFYKDLISVKKLLYTDMTAAKYFAEDPDKVRQKYYGLGLGIAIVGGVLTFLGITNQIAVAIGVGPALIVCAILLIIIANAMPQRTDLGLETYQKALGYKLFISATEKYRQPYFEKANFFMDVLPYAIVFGVADKLAKDFDKMGIVPPTPTWYYGVSPFNPILFAGSMTSFSQAMSTTMQSVPQSGSGGGGFSGGGFGGGGGGSW